MSVRMMSASCRIITNTHTHTPWILEMKSLGLRSRSESVILCRHALKLRLGEHASDVAKFFKQERKVCLFREVGGAQKYFKGR